MSTSTKRASAPATPPRAPAVTVLALLGIAAVFLIAVSALVEGPALTGPGRDIAPAITPTRLDTSR
ncbi:hypothetical protein [Halopolyspora algeriensis]|uniref:hypothetical protein n=1 Tax=Halopolyspora algeriensis TaxID=1500506 RepID=UPI000DF14E6A|nr:hypothetical protein [Halopolyspora algeriensis]